MNRIEAKFLQLKKNNKKAFIAFITAGYPSLEITCKLILEFSRIGVDVIELGVPFSDPIADGPVIQEASGFALNKNTHLIDIINLVKKARLSTQIPICLMTYYNPIFCFGEKEFIEKCYACGVDGVIVPDLPPEEGKSLILLANKANLDVICFISPTTSNPRVKLISQISKGFIYYVSLTGVTGARRSLSGDLIGKLKTIKRITKKPVCVGFGVSTASQVKEASRYADGVIVGSAIVKKIKERIGKPDLVKKVSAFVRSMKG